MKEQAARQVAILPSSSPPPPSPPPLLFESHIGNHAPLLPIQRSAIVVLDKDHPSRSVLASKVGTSLPTVRHWINHYEEKGDVKDEHRSGRPRCTDDAIATAIAGIAIVDPFITPRQLKRHHELDVSSRTIKRRLVEAGLHGRVARHN